jgi:hypothetical protein
MVYVVLRSGKTLRYNSANQYTWSADKEGRLELTEAGRNGGNVASIAIDLVERVEFTPPCAVMRERRKDKLPLRR